MTFDEWWKRKAVGVRAELVKDIARASWDAAIKESGRRTLTKEPGNQANVGGVGVSRECRCTMAQKLVGDGCETCNPEMAADHMRDTIEDQLEEIASLRSALKEIANARPHKWGPERLRGAE